MDKHEMMQSLTRAAYEKGGSNGAWFAPFLRAATGRTAQSVAKMGTLCGKRKV